MVERSDRKVSTAYRQLKERLRTGAFRPGEHLPVEALAAQLRTGLTPLREAMMRLQGEGWVTVRPQEGFFVPVPTVKELRDRYDLATIVLDHVVAVCGTWDALMPADRHPLSPDTLDADRLVLAIEVLLVQIAQGSGNQAVADLIADFVDRSHLIRRIDCEADRGLVRNADRYGLVLSALDAGDRDSTRASLRDLLGSQAQQMTPLIKEALARPHLVAGSGSA
jgi:DNA-binding GntR family transcriptional regulator